MWKELIDNVNPFIRVIEALASIVTVAGVVGIFLVYHQVKLYEEETKLNSIGQIYSQMVDIDKVFLEYPELRLYIYSNIRPENIRSDVKETKYLNKANKGKVQTAADATKSDPVQSMKDQATAFAVAELMLDFFSQVALELPKLGEAGNNWRSYIKDIYKCSPVLRDRYERKYSWYKDEAAAKIINEAKEELSKGEIVCDDIKLPTK